MDKFRKKPVEVFAAQMPSQETWDNMQNGHTVALSVPLMTMTQLMSVSAWDWYETPEGVVIQTPEGNMLASPGDWIIQGDKGEFYPCKPDIFEATYDRIE